MIHSVLVVCMGNICRSPVAERQLALLLPLLRVRSAGLIAIPGQPADSTMISLAEEKGVNLRNHYSQKFTLSMGYDHDLILVMDSEQLALINARFPQISGKSRLLSYWLGSPDIPDPYKKSNEYYRVVYQLITESVDTWKHAL